MIRMLGTVAALLCASGCGPSLMGQWTGDLAVVIACSDGSGTSATDHTTWIIEATNTPKKIQASTTGSCTAIDLTDYGDYAQVDPQPCPVTIVNGAFLTPVITAGEINLVDGSPGPFLTVAVQIHLDLPGKGSCLAHDIGDLLLQPRAPMGKSEHPTRNSETTVP